MLIKLLVHWPIIDVIVRIYYRGVPNHSSTVPFSFNDSTSIVSEFSIPRKFLSEKAAFILTVCLLVYHFALDSHVFLIFTFKYVTVLIFDNNLPMQLVILPFALLYLGPRNHFLQKAVHLIGGTVNFGHLLAYQRVLVS